MFPSLLLLLLRSISHFWDRLRRSFIYVLRGYLGLGFGVLGLLFAFCLKGSMRTNPFIITNILSELDRSIKILYNTVVNYSEISGFG